MSDLDSIYFTARELPPDDRPAYLARACGADHKLRTRVEQMLSVAHEAEAFITNPEEHESEGRVPWWGLLEASELDHAGRLDHLVGRKIGRYKILEHLGEGGCGAVYVAEQTKPLRRRVALKIVRPGMDSRQVISRFEAERQALAMMDHPNIAKVLDAGATEQGRPYFVMDLVRGIRITDYCDQGNLSTDERLGLFIKVCQAIQHAHQKGIIHRDIKPSNILVTLHDGVPVPKVIDFGIAKAIEGRLTNATVYTQLHQFIGTPAYMSPEQAELTGLDIDTRSDIYSLGVLLYELLAGTTPFDPNELVASGVEAMRKTIREKEPVRPSTRIATRKGEESTTITRRRGADTSKLLHQLKGDLDWIVMKCLEKDRRRRYETANGLAMDIQRHRANEPVVARPPSAVYRFRKAWQRNALVFTAAAVVALAMLVGAGVSTWQAVEAKRARKAEATQRIAAQKAQAQAERLVYAGKLMLAQSDFETGNGALAAHYLEGCQQNLRGWEYRYLRTRISAKRTLAGHAREVLCVAFSADGKRVVTGSMDKTAKVWDAETGRKLLDLTGHAHWLTSVAFSPDSKRIVTGAGEWGWPNIFPGETKVWDVETGQEVLALKGHLDCVWSVAFSPDGKRIVTGSEDLTAKVWDAETGRELLSLQGHGHGVRSVLFSPDGKRIVTGSGDSTARVWDAQTGQELLALRGHSSLVFAVAISHDAQRIVTGSADRTAKVWDAATGQEVRTLSGHAEWLTSVAFSPDSKRIITGSADQTAKVWDSRTGQELFALKGHGGYLRSVAFSPDGNRIVTGSEDRTAKLWDGERGQEVPVLAGHTDFVSSIALSSDSKRIVTGSGDGRAKIWDTATGRELLELKGATSRVWGVAGMWSVAVSPDGKRIVTGSNDRTAKVWDAETGAVLLVLEHAEVVSSVAFGPDSKRIVSGVGEWGRPDKLPSEAKVWDAETGEVFLVLEHSDRVRSVAFSPDGKRILTGSDDGTAMVWDARTGRKILAVEHSDKVWSVAFSPGGERILTGSWDQTAKVWDSESGQELLTLKGHTGNVRSVAFSPDGMRIVTGSDDRTAKIWHAKTGQELLALKDHTQMVWSVAFSPDGNRIVTGIAGAGATAKVWSAAPPDAMIEGEQKEDIDEE